MSTNGHHVSNGTDSSNGIAPQITLFTNHGCPWAHRAHITLRALKIPYDEVIIPLDRPREPWYLKVNPRGLVPSIKISNGILQDEIVTESAIVSTFVADLFPNSSFWPATRESPTSALTRARMAFFADTWTGKVNTYMYQVMKAEGEQKEKLGEELVEAVRKEIEPLLEGAGPFFGGSKSITLAEALTAPFVIRYHEFGETGLMPKSMLEGLDALPNYSKWSKAVRAEDSVTYVFDGPATAKRMAERIEKMKADAK